jgi:hypothetical protein
LTRPQATGTTEFGDTENALKLDDTEDAVVGFRTQTPSPNNDPASHSPLAKQNPGAQRRARIEVSSPAPRPLPSVQDRDHNTPEPSESPHNRLAPPPGFLFEQR